MRHPRTLGRWLGLAVLALAILLPGGRAGAEGDLAAAVAQAKGAGLAEALVQRVLSLGWQYDLSNGQTAAFLDVLRQAQGQGLPVAPLANKMQEGLAKRVAPRTVVKVLAEQLDALVFVRGLAAQTLARWGLPATGVTAAELDMLLHPLRAGLSPERMRGLMAAAPRTSLKELADGLEFAAVLGASGLPVVPIDEVVLTGLSSQFFAGRPWELGRAMVEATHAGLSPAQVIDKAMSVIRQGRDVRAVFADAVPAERYDQGPQQGHGQTSEAGRQRLTDAADLGSPAGYAGTDETAPSSSQGQGVGLPTLPGQGGAGRSSGSGSSSGGSSSATCSPPDTGKVGGDPGADADARLVQGPAFDYSGPVLGYNEGGRLLLFWAGGVVAVDGLGPQCFWAGLGLERPLVGEVVRVAGHRHPELQELVAFRLTLRGQEVILRHAASGKAVFDPAMTCAQPTFTSLAVRPFAWQGRIAALSADGAFQLTTQNATVSLASLGPTEFWTALGLSRPQVGDTVLVRGFSLEEGATLRHLPFRLTLRERHVALRDSYTGLPWWQDASRLADPNLLLALAPAFAAEGMVVEVAEDGRSLTLAASGGDMRLEGLGPDGWWQTQGLVKPTVGAFVRAQGRSLTAGRSPRHMLTQLTLDGRTLVLRPEPAFVPAWCEAETGTMVTRLDSVAVRRSGVITALLADGRVLLADGDRKWTLEGLAPYRFWQSQGLLAPQPGERVQMEALQLDGLTGQRLVVQSLVRQGQTYLLRDAVTGLPRW